MTARTSPRPPLLMAHPTWPVEGSEAWWADARAQIIDEYLPAERDGERGLPLVVGAFVTGVLLTLFLFALPFAGLVLTEALRNLGVPAR